MIAAQASGIKFSKIKLKNWSYDIGGDMFDLTKLPNAVAFYRPTGRNNLKTSKIINEISALVLKDNYSVNNVGNVSKYLKKLERLGRRAIPKKLVVKKEPI